MWIRSGADADLRCPHRLQLLLQWISIVGSESEFADASDTYWSSWLFVTHDLSVSHHQVAADPRPMITLTCSTSWCVDARHQLTPDCWIDPLRHTGWSHYALLSSLQVRPDVWVMREDHVSDMQQAALTTVAWGSTSTPSTGITRELCLEIRLNIRIVVQIMSRILISVGGGCSVITSQVASQISVPHQDMGIAIAILGLWTAVGGGVGSAISGSVWSDRLPRYLQENLGEYYTLSELAEMYGDFTKARTAEPRAAVIKGE